MIAIVDADHITYRAAASCSPTKLKPFLESREDAILRADSMMQDLVNTFPTHEFEVYIAGSGNWRYDIYPEYKANRKDVPKPVWLEDVREHLVLQWKAQLVNDKEVDDMCGIRLTEEGNNGVCISLDKDLLTIPGTHYNFVTKTLTEQTPIQALRTFYKQVITGDASDNVPAFDGKFRSTTPAFVHKLLAPIDEMVRETEMYFYCLGIYDNNSNDFSQEVAQEQMHRNAKVLYIQRKEGDQWQMPGQKEESEALL